MIEQILFNTITKIVTYIHNLLFLGIIFKFGARHYLVFKNKVNNIDPKSFLCIYIIFYYINHCLVYILNLKSLFIIILWMVKTEFF